MITLYQYELSPFCDKVRRVLRAKGVPFQVQEITILDTLRGRPKALSPAAKLPVLDLEGERIADSTDICWLLEARFPEPRLVPADPRDQALMHFFEDWADESLYFYEMHLRFTLPHNAERWVPVAAAHDNNLIKRIAATAMPRAMLRTTRAQGTGRKPVTTIKRDLDRHFHMLNQWLEDRDWLVGDSLSLADISVFSQLYCLAGTSEGSDLLRGYENVRAWMRDVDEATSGPAGEGDATVVRDRAEADGAGA
ncbi:MAG: glutathione S-transferase family protein [Pseudomonadota bacterium]